MRDTYIFFFRFFSTIGYYKIALDPEVFIICTKWYTKNEKGASPTAVHTSQADHGIPHMDTSLPGGSGSWSPPSEAQMNWRIENRESLRTAGETKDAHLEEGNLQILETPPHGRNGAAPQGRNSYRSDREGREGLEGLSMGVSLGDQEGCGHPSWGRSDRRLPTDSATLPPQEPS